MFSLSTIQSMNDEAASVAQEEDLQPVEYAGSSVERMAQLMPFIGGHLPTGYERVDLQNEYDASPHGIYMGDNDGFGAYFVDSSGMGGPGEPAMTINDLAEKMREGFAYALVETGQFQVKVGVFKQSA